MPGGVVTNGGYIPPFVTPPRAYGSTHLGAGPRVRFFRGSFPVDPLGTGAFRQAGPTSMSVRPGAAPSDPLGPGTFSQAGQTSMSERPGAVPSDPVRSDPARPIRGEHLGWAGSAP